MVYKSSCWYCDKDFEYLGEQYRDIKCPHCGVLNSITNLKQIDNLQTEGETMILNGKKNYLKTEEVLGGEIVTFLSEGEWIQSKNYKYEDETPRQDFYIKIKILDVEKDMRLNATNRGILIEAFGKETQGWIGKRASLSKMKVLVGGKKMDTIEVTPITEEEPAL